MSYKLHCPTCSSVIPPDKINIQETIAVCANCGSVFNFADKVVNTNTNKVKRRKIRKPDIITQMDMEDRVTLEMPYIHTLPYKALSVVMGLGLVVLYAFIMREVIVDNDGIGVLVLFSLMLLPMIAGFFGSLFTRQIIEANPEHIKHILKLGIPIYERKMAVDSMIDVSLEETEATRASTAEARYNLFADRYDHRQDMFIQNMPEETALYTHQVLSGYLKPDELTDEQSRLADDLTVTRDDLDSQESEDTVNHQHSNIKNL